MPEKLGVAVHGAGWVAGEHLRAYLNNPHCEVRVVSSRREESARRKAAEVGLCCDISTSLEEVLARDDVQIVSLCTPNHLHPAETIACAKAGKHILIEKPVALNLEDLNRMHDAVGEAGVKTVVSFVLRWNPLFDCIKSLLAAGAIGDVFYAETDYFHEIGPWYSGWEWSRTRAIGGSTLLFAGCHAVDALRYFAGDVVEVSAFAARGHRQDFEYWPSIVAVLRLANGGIGKVGASFECEMPYTFPIVLHGSEGAIRDNRLWSKKLLPGQTTWAPIPTILPDSGDVTHHPFQGEVNHLVECIQKNVESHVNLADAVKTHKVCLAIDRSADEGGRPITV